MKSKLLKAILIGSTLFLTNIENSFSWTATRMRRSPANLVQTGGSGTTMDISGPSNPAYGSYVTFTVQNQGSRIAYNVVTTLTNTTNFEFGTNNCASQNLAAYASCTVQVRSKSTVNGAISGALNVDWNY